MPVDRATKDHSKILQSLRNCAYLLERSYKGLEFPRCVLHEEKACQDAVQCGAIPGIGWVIQEWELIGSMVLQHECDDIQLQQQLPTGVSLSEILQDMKNLQAFSESYSKYYHFAECLFRTEQ